MMLQSHIKSPFFCHASFAGEAMKNAGGARGERQGRKRGAPGGAQKCAGAPEIIKMGIYTLSKRRR